jgi:hypothetical protein
MGYMTVYTESEYDVCIDDIITNLSNFDDDELSELKEEIELKLSKRKGNQNSTILVSSTLDEEYKIQILKEMFDKFSWSELEDIKKKIM